MKIKLKNISYSAISYFKLVNVDFEINSPAFVGVIGAADIGSSFLLKIMAGITLPDEGDIYYDNQNIIEINEKNLKELKRKIGYVFDYGGLISNLGISENLLLPLNFHFPDLSESEKMLMIEKWFDFFEIDKSLFFKRPAELSSQHYKIILYVRALMTDPEIIFYDEPFNFIDAKNRDKIIQIIFEKKKNKNIIQIVNSISDYYLYEHSDYNFVLSNGRIVEIGSWKELAESDNPETKNILEDYYKSAL